MSHSIKSYHTRVLALLTLGMFSFASQLSAQVIDFETDGSGAPSGSIFAAGEYAGLGVTINDSSSPVGQTSLNDTNPANIGTPISGKYVNVGAFSGVDTFIELLFPAGTPSLGFNWAGAVGVNNIEVTLFDSSNTPLGPTILDPTTGTFVNNAGFTVSSGTFSAAPAMPIHRVLIEDEAGGTSGLILDNLRFQQIPEPASFVLFGFGMIATLAGSRRSHR